VLSSLATRVAYLELVPQFERLSGETVVTTWAGTVDIMKRVIAGESYDLLIVSKDAIEDLMALKLVEADSRVDLASSGIGVAVRRGTLHPDIGSPDALKRALLAAKVVGYSTGPSGVYLVSLFERMGIAAELRGKTYQVAPGATVGTIIASGEADIGLQQISELMYVDGIDLVGPLPSELQHVTIMSCGLPRAARRPSAARALAHFLTAPAGKDAMERAGLQPV
jgi:molybdate transport system substrate-binding protein